MFKEFEVCNFSDEEEKEGNMGEDKEDEIAEDDTVEQVFLKAPVRPNKEEVEKHRVNHFPFRAWCKHCIKGRAVCPGHYR